MKRQISLGRQILSDEIAAPRPELLLAIGLARTCQEGTTLAQIQTRLHVEAHLTLAGRRQERALHCLLLLPFLPDLLHSILQWMIFLQQIDHSGTIFFLGGWFHSIGLDIYFSHDQLGVALHFVTNDIPGELKRRATLWLHAWPSLLKHGRKEKKLKHFRKR